MIICQLFAKKPGFMAWKDRGEIGNRLDLESGWHDFLISFTRKPASLHISMKRENVGILFAKKRRGCHLEHFAVERYSKG